jgi:hypothetical protein
MAESFDYFDDEVMPAPRPAGLAGVSWRTTEVMLKWSTRCILSSLCRKTTGDWMGFVAQCGASGRLTVSVFILGALLVQACSVEQPVSGPVALTDIICSTRRWSFAPGHDPFGF